MKDELRRAVRTLKENIALQNSLITTLESALDVCDEAETSDNHQDGNSRDDSSYDGSEDSSLLSAQWDAAEHIFRCLLCGWEVVEGVCQSCGSEYMPNEHLDMDTTLSLSTENTALMDDRCLTPRGTTPLRYISDSSIGSLYWAHGYYRPDFINLLQRGATEAMCYKFSLEFTQEKGIVAWADQDIYEKFSGPGMLVGDFWKIHLGRRIQLEPDDLDGSGFLQDLLEDALIHPLRSSLSKHIEDRWETVEESPGIWVTRPMGNTNSRHNDNDDWHADCDDREEAKLLTQHADEALERQHNETESYPVVLQDEYETSEGEHDSDVEMDDLGWAWYARRPDRAFVADSEVDLLEEDGRDVGVTEASTVEVEDWSNDFADSADSDFDSDELLSGDEYVLEGASSGPAPGTV